MHILAQGILADFGPHLFAGLVAAVASYGANRFFLGELSQKVRTHGDWLKSLDPKVEEHGETLARHDERLKAGGL